MLTSWLRLSEGVTLTFPLYRLGSACRRLGLAYMASFWDPRRRLAATRCWFLVFYARDADAAQVKKPLPATPWIWKS
ncbi:hypothetical protein MTO96_036330 [Rhipicephalus appendiculatus]